MNYIGIDLHSNNSVVVVTDEEVRVVAAKRLPVAANLKLVVAGRRENGFSWFGFSSLAH